ncbi:MAG TPA: hypothetical protein DCF99_02755, partial [Flavobacteriaceae bacterium]|nr:hypothetical protein [Flavobacteriaceae bacterium]
MTVINLDKDINDSFLKKRIKNILLRIILLKIILKIIVFRVWKNEKAFYICTRNTAINCVIGELA